MIKLQINYPDNFDICSNELPIPEHIKTKDKVLLFPEKEQYWFM